MQNSSCDIEFPFVPVIQFILKNHRQRSWNRHKDHEIFNNITAVIKVSDLHPTRREKKEESTNQIKKKKKFLKILVQISVNTF